MPIANELDRDQEMYVQRRFVGPTVRTAMDAS